MPDFSLIMLAAGNSTRFGLKVKKQFLRLNDEPLWLFSTKNLSKFYPFDKIIVTSGNTSYMRRFNDDFIFVEGGQSRTQSLKNALEFVESKFVVVSDAARVDISKDLFDRLLQGIHDFDCVTPFLNVADTAILGEKALQREKIKLIQTPQISRTSLLKKALENGEFTDDSTAILSLGGKVNFIAGEENARKITFKEDLKKLNLPPPALEFFSGNGFDVHKFGANRPLLLGGIIVHENMGVEAHSDGDILAHSLSDALLGAAGLGDIGEHFSDTDERWRNADSMQILKKTYEMAQSFGFELVNADITIMAEAPKIKEFKSKIAKNLAKCLNLAEFRFNIKATTTEKLGFLGRKEGIAVFSSVNLKYFDWTKI